jgi:hypothetical protein
VLCLIAQTRDYGWSRVRARLPRGYVNFGRDSVKKSKKGRAMVRRGQTLLREHEGVSSPKRRETEVLPLLCGNLSRFCQVEFVTSIFWSFETLVTSDHLGLWFGHVFA